ncbi:MAG: glycogen synthase [Gemmatimonadetes bacterium]|nr:glycogen synthase [Gemmatimonadota bacterium]
MRILFATPEAAPYWKSGGLAEVARALPDALAARGHEVRIIHPLYRTVRTRPPELAPAGAARLPWPGRGVRVRYFEHRPPGGVPAIFVEHWRSFDVEDVYQPTRADPLAHGRRFALFCRAIVQHARAWGADIVHLNDWQTGLVPVYGLLDGMEAATIFNIHNLAFQGNFPSALLEEIGIPGDLFRTENGLEFFGSASFLKGGLALSDRLIAVSPTYAREIQTPEYGAGMDGLLRFRRRMLVGILNGIDPATWDPAADESVPARFDAEHVQRRASNREALLHELGLDGRGPLFVMVTRLTHQKGLDLVVAALPRLLRDGARLAVLGEGDAAYEEALSRAAAEHPRRVAAIFRFDDALARRLYAGGDFFLMPSLFEPCGLGQMIAQRYGLPPVVRRTGGLADTVEDGVTGFTFGPATADALVQAAARARTAWRGPDWDELRRRCMRLDHSWTRSAARYEQVYRAALGDAAA